VECTTQPVFGSVPLHAKNPDYQNTYCPARLFLLREVALRHVAFVEGEAVMKQILAMLFVGTVLSSAVAPADAVTFKLCGSGGGARIYRNLYPWPHIQRQVYQKLQDRNANLVVRPSCVLDRNVAQR
jgi:hypothetical protein